MKIYVMVQNGYVYEYISDNDFPVYYHGVNVKLRGKKKEEIYLTASIEGIDLYKIKKSCLIKGELIYPAILYKEDLIKIHTF